MIISLIVIFILFMLDQGSKYLTEINLAEGEVREVIPGFLKITKIYNTGAGWGMLDNATWLLVIISAIATVVLAYFVMQNNWKKEKFKSFIMCLLFAGCVGNLYDRLVSVLPFTKAARPGVVDMIKWSWFDWFTSSLHLGTTIFNVADFFLVTGLVLLILYLIVTEVRAYVKSKSRK